MQVILVLKLSVPFLLTRTPSSTILAVAKGVARDAACVFRAVTGDASTVYYRSMWRSWCYPDPCPWQRKGGWKSKPCHSRATDTRGVGGDAKSRPREGRSEGRCGAPGEDWNDLIHHISSTGHHYTTHQVIILLISYQFHFLTLMKLLSYASQRVCAVTETSRPI